MENIIEITDLNFGYDPGTLNLENVSFTVPRGCSGCIVGPNGGGKSTLLKLLLGLLTPTAGRIRIFGVSPVEARSKIGYMPQYHKLDAAFPVSVLEVALMGRMRRNFWGRYSEKDRQAALAALDEMGIADLEKRSFSALSGGQRQRVLISRAIAGEPEILILDDSSSALDYKTDANLRQALVSALPNSTVITVAQRVSSVKGCDLILVIEDGEIIGCGKHEELMESCAEYKEISDSQMGGAFLD